MTHVPVVRGRRGAGPRSRKAKRLKRAHAQESPRQAQPHQRPAAPDALELAEVQKSWTPRGGLTLRQSQAPLSPERDKSRDLRSVT